MLDLRLFLLRTRAPLVVTFVVNCFNALAFEIVFFFMYILFHLQPYLFGFGRFFSSFFFDLLPWRSANKVIFWFSSIENIESFFFSSCQSFVAVEKIANNIDFFFLSLEELFSFDLKAWKIVLLVNKKRTDFRWCK